MKVPYCDICECRLEKLEIDCNTKIAITASLSLHDPNYLSQVYEDVCGGCLEEICRFIKELKKETHG